MSRAAGHVTPPPSPPVIYAHYLLAADRSPLNFEPDAWGKYVENVAICGYAGIQLCLKTLEEMRPSWHEALHDIARNRNAHWHTDEEPSQSLKCVEDGFKDIMNQLRTRLKSKGLPALYNLDMHVLRQIQPELPS